MALETYRKKRDFKATPEPPGRTASSPGGDSFVIQKHAARRLHYDFRLEMDGVLKSWAVTRGPSLVPGEKRLAVHTEDHPLDYGDFEGTIPKGEYGGGTVIVWDRGRWSPIGDPHRGYAKGHLEFELEGEKLHGRWHLVRMHGKPRERTENWLLIKGDDEAARGERDPDILEERPESVKTGRVVEEVEGEKPGWSSKTGRIEPDPGDPPAKTPSSRKPAATKPAANKPAVARAKAKSSAGPRGLKEPAAKARGGAAKDGAPAAEPVAEIVMPKGAKKDRLPSFVEPSLATLVTKAPAGPRWLHEIKYDGYRLQARVEAGRVKLLTRSGLDWTAKFGKELVNALRALPVGTALIDGELVVENGAGVSDFSALQAELSAGRSDRFVFYAFDLLFLDGMDLRDVPLITRKDTLKQVLAGIGDPIRYSDHFTENGDLILRHACRLSLEGVVSKRADGPYRSGRAKEWVKSKCSERQEFVVAGYVPSTTSRKAIGSLVLGYYADGKFVHAGRVGTGFTAAVAEDLFERLERLRGDASPFAAKLGADEARGVRFVEPKLVAEVEFRGWTADHSLRHASFRGLREDKAAADVVREADEDTGKPTSKPALKASPPRPAVKLTHPDRVYWPDVGVTKEGLADYYAEVWPRMGPYVAGRPLALVRCPGGVGQQCFFQKHSWQGANRFIRQVPDPGDPQAEPLLVIDDLGGLIGLVQAGVLEVHPWGSLLADIEKPDMIIMDLDPAEDVSWPVIVAAAREVKDRFAAAGLASFIKTSGGKGLHVVASLKPSAEWAEVKAFAKGIADSMASDAPDSFVAVVSKAKRKGKILVDYLRNGRGATAVSAYSTRARPGATVSMPIEWEELDQPIRPDYFTVMNTPSRLANLARDPWEDFRRAALPLPGAKPSGKGRRKG